MFDIKFQPELPFDAIIFDCDGTLSQIEGIEFLARLNGVEEVVRQLTEVAMSRTGITPDLYQKRLAITEPKKQQVSQVAEEYFAHLTPDVDQVIATFQSYNKSIFVISAGVYQSVVGFAQKLHIPVENVFAVEVFFDEAGKYIDFDRSSPLSDRQGKASIVEHIKKNRRMLLVGDGMNDVEAANSVERFVGYGGVVYRENVAKHSQFYMMTRSLAALLPLSLTHQETARLPASFKALYEKGLQAIQEGKLLIEESIR